MKTILFIEDDPILSRVYRKALEAADFEVKLAVDGEAGLAQLQVLRPDLILLDLMLPRISGMDLLRIIRNSEDFKMTPIVVFSSSFRSEVRDEAERLGASRLLSKSEFVPRQVIAVIKELLPGTSRLVTGSAGRSQGSAEASAQVPRLVQECGQLVLDINRRPDFFNRSGKLHELKTAINEVGNLAVQLGWGPQAYFCEALGALVGETLMRPTYLGTSTLRTLTQSVDFLAESCDSSRHFDISDYAAFDLLIVDGDSISRCGVQLALRKIKQRGTECSNGPDALSLVESKGYDMVFLDVELPGLDGFDLCSRIRRSGANRATPIIFVTRHADLQARAKATMSGGTDFVAKPFDFMELAVKSLLHLLRRRLIWVQPAGENVLASEDPN